MIKAKDIMNDDIVIVDPDDTVEQVMALMLEHGISGLPVVDMAGQLEGIITEFDLLDLVWDAKTTRNKVFHYMTRDVHTVDAEEELTDAADLFRVLSIRRLIVLSNGRVAGIISRRDLLRHVLELREQVTQSQTV